MAKFVLDTNILIGIVRGATWAKNVVNAFGVFDNENYVYISTISRVEIKTMAYRLNWGEQKQKRLLDLLSKIPQIDINDERIENRYIEINAYSEGKHHTEKLPKGTTSFKIGDHDIWIASTASVINAKLISADKDFEKINSVFVDYQFVPQTR